jgi:hypothetical protein
MGLRLNLSKSRVSSRTRANRVFLREAAADKHGVGLRVNSAAARGSHRVGRSPWIPTRAETAAWATSVPPLLPRPAGPAVEPLEVWRVDVPRPARRVVYGRTEGHAHDGRATGNWYFPYEHAFGLPRAAKIRNAPGSKSRKPVGSNVRDPYSLAGYLAAPIPSAALGRTARARDRDLRVLAALTRGRRVIPNAGAGCRQVIANPPPLPLKLA